MADQGNAVKKTFEDVSQVVKKLKVEIPAQMVEKKKDESFLQLQKSAKVQGFRPGKVPLSIIKTRFRDSVIERLEEDLVKDGYYEAVKESSIRAVAIKKIEDGKYIEGKDFRFTALIEVLPDFEPSGYEGIEISKLDQDVTDEEIHAEIDRMREGHAVYKPVLRESGENDLLELDFKAFHDDELIEEQGDSTYLISGNSTLGEDFEEHLKGKKAGDDLDFEITYPEDFNIDQVKGKRMRYMIGVKSVKEKVLPEADDEFAKSIPDVRSLDELKGKIEEHLSSQKEQEGKRKQQEQIIDALIEKNSIEIPDTLVEEEIVRMIRDTESRLQSQGVKFDPSQVNVMQLKERYRERAVRSVKSSLILAEIARKEKVEVTDEDMENEMKAMGENFNIPYEKVASYYEEENTHRALKNSILDRKVMEFLLKRGVPVAEKGSKEQDGKENAEGV